MTSCRVRAVQHGLSVSVHRMKWPARVVRHRLCQSRRKKYDEAELEERQRDHALFIAFAPFDNPRIAVALIVENGESGSGVAAPIAKSIMDAYLGYGDDAQ